MDWVLVGLVIVGVGVYSFYKEKKKRDDYIVYCIKTRQGIYNRFPKNDD